MADAALRDALASSQRLGMLGDRPIDEIIEHALAFVDALADVQGHVVDLGSGGGVPGLVVARHRPDLRVLLVDRRSARADHLVRLVRRLELTPQVEVRVTDAFLLECGPVAAVTARGFGSPALTAAAALRVLAPNGLLVVSEPPGSPIDRWALIPGVTREAWPDRRVARLRRST